MKNLLYPHPSGALKPSSSFSKGDNGPANYPLAPSQMHIKKPYLRNSFTPVFDKPSHAVHIPAHFDQDLDSLKLSIQADVAQGHRDFLRFKSNYHQKFFKDIETSAYNRLSTEITSLYKLPKVLRTLKAESKSRTKCISISPYKKIKTNLVRPNELSFLIELKNSPRRVLPKIRARNVQAVNEIEEFEQKLKDLSEGNIKKSVKELYHTRKKYL